MEQVFSVGAEKTDQDILSIYMFTIYKLNLIISFKLPSQMMTIGKKKILSWKTLVSHVTWY